MTPSLSSLAASFAAVVLSVGLAAQGPQAGADAPRQAPVDFVREVLPILESRCTSCHQETHRDERGRLREPKAGLRLDGRGWILKGSEFEAVVVPGDAAGSTLYTRTTLAADDDDVMPAKGDPLTPAQQDVLRRWIDGGAGFGDWVGKPGPTADEAVETTVAPLNTPLMQLRTRLADGVSPAADSSIRGAAGDVGRIEPVQPGSPLLRVSYLAHEDAVDDGRVARLEPLRRQVTHLVLARTAVTDRGLRSLARFEALTVLDLRGTAVGDRGLEALAGLPQLRTLNLVGTKVSDRGLRHLEGMQTLEQVFLLGSGATEAGVARLRAALPKARVHFALELPEVPADAGQGDRRRRR